MEELEQEWNALVAAGNEAFNQSSWVVALSFYSQALNLIRSRFQEVFEKDKDKNKVLTCMVVCFFNMADVLVRIGDKNKAIQQFYYCFQFLERQLQGKNAQCAVMVLFPQARMEWLLFKNRGVNRQRLIDPPALKRIEQHFQKESSRLCC